MNESEVRPTIIKCPVCGNSMKTSFSRIKTGDIKCSKCGYRFKQGDLFP